MTRHLALGSWILFAAFAASHCSKPAEEAVETTAPISVRVEAARLEVLQTPIVATGSVTPSPGGDWTITAPDTGRVVELPKAEGDLVKAGDLLVRFEIPALTTELIARQSELLQAASRLQTAKAAAARMTTLVQRGIAPQRDLDDAQRELQEAEVGMRQAESARASVESMSARTLVYARFPGTVARRWHNPGDAVEASAADPILRVIDPTRLEITAPVPADQLSLITPGQPAKIFNPADGSEIAGAVIARQASADGSSANGEIRVSLSMTPSTLVVGAPIQVEIMGDSKTTVLTVPSAAVFREGDAVYVAVTGADGNAHRKIVKIGIVARNRTQILSGIVAGDSVILAGPEPPADGAAIVVIR